MNLHPAIRLLFRTIFAIFVVCLLSACGGSQDPVSTAKSATPEGPLTGTFVDSAVSGLHYATDTQSGTTNEAGEYLFYPGESITFSVGSVQLPSAPATIEMTPLDLAGTDRLDSTVVVNILQFLQTLDDDQNADNGIELETAAAFINNLTVDFADENFSSQEAVQQIVKIAPANTNNRLIDADVALEHFGSSLIMLADPPSSEYTNTAGAGDEFYIVYEDQQYNGDMIIFSRKHFALTNDGQLSDGKYDASSNVWHLWNRKERQHHFVMVSDTLGGSLETCWAATAKKAIDCNDEDATIAYLFSDETDAQSFNSNTEIGPEPTQITSIEPMALPIAERESVSLAAAQAESTDAAEAAVIKTEDELLAMQQAIDAEAEKDAARLAAEQAEAAAEAAAVEEFEKLAAEKREAEELEIARLAKIEEAAALAAVALAAEELEAAELAAKKAAEEEAIAIAKAQADKEAAEAAAAQAQAEADRIAAEQAEADRIAAEQAEADRIAAEQAEADRIAAEQAEAELASNLGDVSRDPATVECTAGAEDLKAAILEMTNEARLSDRICGGVIWPATAELQWNADLAQAARNHSTDMATYLFFSHTGSDGLKVADRAREAGFTGSYIGENIASGQHTVGIVQHDWLASAGHCENIMRSGFTHMGAACIEVDKQYGSYQYKDRLWTVVFGRQ